MTLPLASALVEEWKVLEDPAGTTVRWTFAAEPRALSTVAGPLMPAVMGGLFRRAMANLERRLSE